MRNLVNCVIIFHVILKTCKNLNKFEVTKIGLGVCKLSAHPQMQHSEQEHSVMKAENPATFFRAPDSVSLVGGFFIQSDQAHKQLPYFFILLKLRRGAPEYTLYNVLIWT